MKWIHVLVEANDDVQLLLWHVDKLIHEFVA
jgi:hypothetical protein